MESKLDKKLENQREQTKKGGAVCGVFVRAAVFSPTGSLPSESRLAEIIFYLKSIPVSLICSGLLIKLLRKPGRYTHFQRIIMKECVQMTSPSLRYVSLRNDIYKAQGLKREPQTGKDKQTSQTFSVIHNRSENQGRRRLSPKLLSLK